MAPSPAQKRGIRHVSGILDGLVLSSMPFHPLRTLPPPILDSSEVIDTVQGHCEGSKIRLHCYTAPPSAPKRGIRHVIGILDILVLSSMPFHPLRTLPPPILILLRSSTQCKGTARSHLYTAPPPAPTHGIRHVSGILDGLYCHPCHFTHSELFPHPSWIVLRSFTQCNGTVRAL